jgi:hypothetical protein
VRKLQIRLVPNQSTLPRLAHARTAPPLTPHAVTAEQKDASENSQMSSVLILANASAEPPYSRFYRMGDAIALTLLTAVVMRVLIRRGLFARVAIRLVKHAPHRVLLGVLFVVTVLLPLREPAQFR